MFRETLQHPTQKIQKQFQPSIQVSTQINKATEHTVLPPEGVLLGNVPGPDPTTEVVTQTPSSKGKFRFSFVSQPSESTAAQNRVHGKKGKVGLSQSIPVFKSPIPLPPILLGLPHDCPKDSLEAALRFVGVYCMEPVGIWDTNSYMKYKQKENLFSIADGSAVQGNFKLISKVNFQLPYGNLTVEKVRNSLNAFNSRIELTGEFESPKSEVHFYQQSPLSGAVSIKKEEEKQSTLYLYRQSLESLPSHMRDPSNLRLVAPFAKPLRAGRRGRIFKSHNCPTDVGLKQVFSSSDGQTEMQIGLIRSCLRKGLYK